MIVEFLTRLRFFFMRKAHGDIDEELQFHLEQSIWAKIAAGIEPLEARRLAILEFGGAERVREECHEQRPGWFVGTVGQDARYALRGFGRNSLFTATVITTLALGIGATTAVFSVVDPILFRSLPYAHVQQIVSAGMMHSLERQEFLMGRFYYDWRDNQKPFEAMAAQGTMSHACDLVETNPAQVNCFSFDSGFLPLLGVAPVLGRNFLSEEDRPNGPRVALISYGLWRSHYNLDSEILNRLIDIEGKPTRVVGVLPRGFQLPTLELADVILPLALNEAEERNAIPGGGMRIFARLKPGVSVAQAKAELAPLFEEERKWIPPEIRNDFHLSVRSLHDRQTQDVQLVAWILLGSVLAVLLIACANVASLMLARGVAREGELAVRSALGASRGRLIRQTLTEAFLMSFAGAVAGLVVAELLLLIFVAMAPTSIPFLEKVHLDLRIALFTVLLSVLCGAIFGLTPALQRPPSVTLSSRTTNSRKHAFMRQSLVVGQIAISMILLASAALMLRSFMKMEQQNLGIQTRGVLTARIALPHFRYDTDLKQMEFSLQAEAALRRLPGIRAVGWTESLPVGVGWQGGLRYAELAVAGRPRLAPGTGGSVVWRGVTPDYFRVLDIPIVRGRNFTEEDRSSKQNLLVLSRISVARMFPGEDPLGKRIQVGPNGPWYTVVGVAANVRKDLSAPDEPEFYWLRRNTVADWSSASRTPVMIFATGLSPEAAASWVRSQIAHLDPTVPVEIELLTERVKRLADRPRFETALLGFFALTGLAMAVIGLYGVTSFLATQRTKEIGVRMALGATRADILRMIAREGMRLMVLGGLFGLVAALAITQLLKSLLFSIGPHDPITFIGVALLLAMVALAATLVPAHTAMSVEPVVALRHE
jgi:putative ABC transport system permease protein